MNNKSFNFISWVNLKNNKKLLIIIISMILLTVVVAGGFIFSDRSDLKQNIELVSNIPIIKEVKQVSLEKNLHTVEKVDANNIVTKTIIENKKETDLQIEKKNEIIKIEKQKALTLKQNTLKLEQENLEKKKKQAEVESQQQALFREKELQQEKDRELELKKNRSLTEKAIKKQSELHSAGKMF